MSDDISLVKRFIGHLTTINKHKFLVTKMCFQMGLYRQGILHDLSKYSPVEFFAGVKYWQGNRSPIDREKEVLGYSLGWLHHKGRNKHHWEYWMDIQKGEVIFYAAPKNIVKEMVCDRVAACMTYQKEKYTDASALNYLNNSRVLYVINPDTVLLLQKYLTWIKDYGLDRGLKMIKHD